MSFAWVKRGGDSSFQRDTFTPVPLEGLSAVGFLAAFLASKFKSWGVEGHQVSLYLVAPGGTTHSPTQGAIDAALSDDGRRLGEGIPLEEAGVASGSWVVARVPPPEGHTAMCTPEQAKEAQQKIGQVLTTRAKRRVSTTLGYFFDGTLTDGVGRPCTVYAIIAPSGALGAAKVYYTSHADAATREATVSKGLTALAGSRSDLQGLRPCIVCYEPAVSPMDIGGGRLALIMPLFPRTLQHLALNLHSHVPLPPAFLLRVLGDVLGALVLMHAAGLAHCDVKADNVMVTGEGRGVLIDLASATPFGEAMEEGLPEELRLGYEGPAHPQQDVNGLVCVMWALLQGGGFPPSGSTPMTLAAALESEGGERETTGGVWGGGGYALVQSAVLALLRGTSVQGVWADVQVGLGGFCP